MHRLKSVGVLSVAKLFTLLYGAMGLLMVPFFLLFSAMASMAGKETGGANALPAAFGVIFAVLMPVFYAAIGFVFGALSAFLYNVFAGWVGGIEVDLQPVAMAPPAPMQANS